MTRRPTWLRLALLAVALNACAEVFSPQGAAPADGAERPPTSAPMVSDDPAWLEWIRVQQYRFELMNRPAATVLRVPVRGMTKRRVANTFGAPRGGGRLHEGLDIFAAAGTPVVSATGGIVSRASSNTLGGLVIYTLGAGGRTYYYAHLSRHGAFKEGDFIKPGDVLGYVGNTGNAQGTPPHLHFGVYELDWTAVNPYRLLSAE